MSLNSSDQDPWAKPSGSKQPESNKGDQRNWENDGKRKEQSPLTLRKYSIVY